MGAAELDEAYYEIVNELLPKAAPVGAYAMGIASALAVASHLQPDIRLLYNASKASSPRAAVVIFDAWKREQQKEQIGP